MSSIGLVYDDLFLTHGETWHPENRERLHVALTHLEQTGWIDRLTPLKFGPASDDQTLWLHDADYLEYLQDICAHGGDIFGVDTIATKATCDAAMLAAGGCIAAAHAAVGEGPDRSVCLVRPPGHHARADTAMGFCFLNNVALAAEGVIRSGIDRVAIVDFDVHHGNGTQDMFYHRRDVLYISLHEHGLFPGTGNLDEVGIEDGAGFNINIPLLPGAGDGHYRTAFSSVVLPALDEYEPQLILVSAGYDIHHSDRIAHMNCSVRAFHDMTTDLLSAARRHAGGRIVLVLEGGYSLDWLPSGLESSLVALAGEPALDIDDECPPMHEDQMARVQGGLERATQTHRERLGLGRKLDL